MTGKECTVCTHYEHINCHLGHTIKTKVRSFRHDVKMWDEIRLYLWKCPPYLVLGPFGPLFGSLDRIGFRFGRFRPCFLFLLNCFFPLCKRFSYCSVSEMPTVVSPVESSRIRIYSGCVQTHAICPLFPDPQFAAIWLIDAVCNAVLDTAKKPLQTTRRPKPTKHKTLQKKF